MQHGLSFLFRGADIAIWKSALKFQPYPIHFDESHTSEAGTTAVIGLLFDVARQNRFRISLQRLTMPDLCREPRTRWFTINARSRWLPDRIGRRLCPLTDATFAFGSRQSRWPVSVARSTSSDWTWDFGNSSFR